MMARAEIERVIAALHAARVAGDLNGMCRLFAETGGFEIAGASADKAIAIRANGIAEFRPWLSMMTKVFRVSDYALRSLVIEAPRASAHWHANITSRVTGVTVSTDLVDLVEVQAGSIVKYSEFFVPR